MSKRKKHKRPNPYEDKPYKVGRGKPPKEHQFKPGQSGNPNGSRAHDPEKQAIKKLTQAELSEIANLVLKGDVEELRELKDNDKETVLKRMVASVAIRIISKGDMFAFDTLLDRLIGKVKKQVDVSGIPAIPQGIQPAQVIISLPSNGREAPKPLEAS